MTELFDVITAINRLKDKVAELSRRVDFIIRYPSLIGNVKYLDEKTVMKMLKVSKATLFRLRAHNQIDYISYGRKILYNKDSIDEFLKKRSKNSKSAA